MAFGNIGNFSGFNQHHTQIDAFNLQQQLQTQATLKIWHEFLNSKPHAAVQANAEALSKQGFAVLNDSTKISEIGQGAVASLVSKPEDKGAVKPVAAVAAAATPAPTAPSKPMGRSPGDGGR